MNLAELRLFGGEMIFLVGFFLVVCSSLPSADGAMEPNDRRYQIVHDTFSEVEVVTPVQLDGDPLASKQVNSSRKRPKRGTTAPEDLFFSVRGLNEDFHISVSSVKGLLAPGFKVYRRHAEGHREGHTVVEDVDETCLYSGRLINRNFSQVALHACSGLRGFIRTPSEEFLIEPVVTPGVISDVSSPHILRKRSILGGIHPIGEKEDNKKIVPESQTHYCGKRRRYMPRRPQRKNFWLPGEFSSLKRQKREMSLSGDEVTPGQRKKNLETLAVVDRAMIERHGDQAILTYVLTVFNMVAVLYQDGTIGEEVAIVLVGLVLLEKEEPGLSLTHNAEKSLSSFCQWQSTIHATDGTRHDHAVLLTGLDICSWKDEPCDTLGYAPVSGMCSKYRSCTINEDTGLALAFTVAHEMGHSFGLLHDDRSSTCGETRGSIMSPVLSGMDGTFRWSDCSRQDLAKFLASTRATCLENEPQLSSQFKFPDTLPGQLYDADIQCKFQFGFRSKICNMYQSEHDICKSLWCQAGGKTCETKFLPAAEGTPCGNEQWCRKGVCVPHGTNSPPPIDGGWGLFSKWSSCSKSCGGGVKLRVRKCDSPRPMHGGKQCTGEDRQYKVCKTTACPSLAQDTRCTVFNNRTLRGRKYNWKPYHGELGALSRCRVYCVPDNATFFVLSTKLEDGTSCRRNFSAVCIDGKCQTVGCDGEVRSNAVPDLCGVCGGDNSTCSLVTGTFTHRNISSGYHQVVQISTGSRNIRVVEYEAGPSHLALRTPNGHYYLSGRPAEDWTGKHLAGGTEFVFRRKHGRQEGFFTRGPTSEDLIVEVLTKDQASPNVSFQFVAPIVANWSQPKSSGESPSERRVTPRCYGDCGIVQPRPRCSSQKGRHCNTTWGSPSNPQSARWKTGSWTPCKGHRCIRGWRYRPVQCVSGQDIVVPDNFCSHIQRPNNRQNCIPQHCTFAWKASPWSKCSVTCGGGYQTRKLHCTNTKTSTDSVRTRGEPKRSRDHPSTVLCDPLTRPAHSRRCNSEPCPSQLQRPGCHDYHEWCSLVQKHSLCQRQFYARKCCKSCHRTDRQMD